MAWADVTYARRFWQDATSLSDNDVLTLLTVATAQCERYAPALPEGTFPPENYRMAAVYQAREVWAASQRSGDVIGVGDYAIRAQPLTPTVRALLRPESPLPTFGGYR